MGATAVTMSVWNQWSSAGSRRARSLQHKQERAWAVAPVPRQHEISRIASNRRLRDPYVRWCGREGPRGFFLVSFESRLLSFD